jgi:hypothetical protein
MTDGEAARVAMCGVDDLALRVGLDPRSDLTLSDAYAAPVPVLLAWEAILDARDRIDRRRRLLSAHQAAIDAARKGRR